MLRTSSRTGGVDEAADIDPVVGKRRRHRFPDIGERGGMHDGAGAVLREGGPQRTKLGVAS
jgi:hypothetical protein